jgi:chromosome partitioning protein
MEYGALRLLRSAPHVIVVGNAKGGTDKTTLAMHVAVGLLYAGQKVGTLDLDPDQQCLTCYFDNRRTWANTWANHGEIDLVMPLHRHVVSATGMRADDNEATDLASLEAAIAALAPCCDFLVIDTPSQDTYLARIAHLIADSILTPLQDSFLDLCSLAVLDPVTREIVRTGHYAASVCAARKARRRFDSDFSDWVVIRRRTAGSPLTEPALGEIGRQIGFRHIAGLSEGPLYRQLFPLGLTALDPLPPMSPGMNDVSHLAARSEVDTLIHDLHLPFGERGLRRAAARAEWFTRRALPLQFDEILAEEE